MTRATCKPGFSASMRNIVAPRPALMLSPVRAMQIANAAPSAPVMNHLRPEIDQPSSTFVAVVASMAGSEPAPGAVGHREARADRACRERGEVAGALLFGGYHRQHVHVALVRRGAVERLRPEEAVSRLFEHGRLAACVQAQPTERHAHVRGKEPCDTRCVLQLRPQAVIQAVFGVVSLLGRDHGRLDEGGHPVAQLGDLGAGIKIDHRASRGLLSERRAVARDVLVDRARMVAGQEFERCRWGCGRALPG